MLYGMIVKYDICHKSDHTCHGHGYMITCHRKEYRKI